MTNRIKRLPLHDAATVHEYGTSCEVGIAVTAREELLPGDLLLWMADESLALLAIDRRRTVIPPTIANAIVLRPNSAKIDPDYLKYFIDYVIQRRNKQGNSEPLAGQLARWAGNLVLPLRDHNAQRLAVDRITTAYTLSSRLREASVKLEQIQSDSCVDPVLDLNYAVWIKSTELIQAVQRSSFNTVNGNAPNSKE